MAVLIEMPCVDGLILFETGCSNDMDKVAHRRSNPA